MKENIYTKRSLQLNQKTNIKKQQSKMLPSVSKYYKELETGHWPQLASSLIPC